MCVYIYVYNYLSLSLSLSLSLFTYICTYTYTSQNSARLGAQLHCYTPGPPKVGKKMAQTHKCVKKATSLHALGVPVKIAYSATYFLCCLGAEFERTRVTPTPGTKDEFGLPMSFAEHPRTERGSRGLRESKIRLWVFAFGFSA